MTKNQVTTNINVETTNRPNRPPIVAVLGHVDHGKTSLLDRIRETHVAEKESGGITQAIGAYQINFKNQEITFIDTPGHAAFTKMRSCGGQAADLVILVVAADDGVKPQTRESIDCIKQAGVPFLVAINKTDLPAADIERVKNQLAENGVLVEGYGGDVVVLPVSAKTGAGIEELLEMILLLAEIHEIKADPEGPLQGIIIESKKEKAGPVGTVVVRNGTLRVGEQILAGGVSTKVRGLMDSFGRRQNEIQPGMAGEILGFLTPPPVGAMVVRVTTGEETKINENEPLKIPKLSPEEEKKYKIVLRADTTGSLEAIAASLSPEVLLVSAGVGEIMNADIMLAKVLQATVYVFRTKISGDVAKLAESEKVAVKSFDIIYKLLEEVEETGIKTNQQEAAKKILGKAEILAEFVVGADHIAGGRVLEGYLKADSKVNLERAGKLVGETQIISLKQRSKDVGEVKAKEEFGVVFQPTLDFKVGDMLISQASK